MPKPLVVYRTDLESSPLSGGDVMSRVTIDHASAGCANMVQRAWYYPPRARLAHGSDVGEEVLFVIDGQATLVEGQNTWPLGSGSAALIPPGKNYLLVNGGEGGLRVISVMSPQPGLSPQPGPEPLFRRETIGFADPELVVAQTAGPDRRFKVLFDLELGSRYLTQFLGYIEKSESPPHKHEYEEVIFICKGQGIAHFEHGDFEIGSGDSIYLPPGALHCLENPADEPLILMGVLSPPLSPGSRY